MTLTTINTRATLPDDVQVWRRGGDIHCESGVVGSSSSTRMLMKVPSGPSFKMQILSALLCANSVAAHGHPTRGSKDAVRTTTLHRFVPRQLSTSGIIPIAVVGGVAVLMAIFAFYTWRKACIGFLRRCREHVADPEAVNYSTEPRELTAEQLAGSINGPGYTPRTRRGRRARRTPSQMSTHSLPLYAKEPGEQELVVLQCPADMDGVPIPQPLATVIDLGEEAEAETGADDGQRSRYALMPDSSPSSPLLEDTMTVGGVSPDSPAIPHRHSGSTGTSNESADTSSLAPADPVDRDDSASPPDRGEAPPYFEVVDADYSVRREIASAESPDTPTSPAPGESNSPPSSPRRTGLRSLLNRMSNSAASHARNNSSLSGVSLQSRRRSHARGSSAASVLRPVSRQRSYNSHNGSRPNISSPSMISLNSISAPLTHTAVRTEFTYPKGGLTADQMRMISSRDSLVRFGVPYGPDAVAFASLSRDNLVMPPGFEETVTPGSGNSSDANADSAAGASGGGESDEITRVQEATTSNGDSREIAVGDSAASCANGLPAERVPAVINVEGLPAVNGALKEDQSSGAQEQSKVEEQRTQTIGNSDQEVNPNPTTADHSKSENGSDQGKAKEITADEQSPPVHGSEQDAQGSPHVGSTTPHDALSKTNSDLSTPPEARPSDSIVESVEMKQAAPLSNPTTTSTSSSRTITNELPSDAPRSAKALAAPPPSSYHPIFSQDIRPESRASQMSYASDATFRTAAESLSSRRQRYTSDDEDDDDQATWECERSPTPTLGGKDVAGHEEEDMDTTFTTSPNESRTSSVNRMKHMSSATIRA